MRRSWVRFPHAAPTNQQVNGLFPSCQLIRPSPRSHSRSQLAPERCSLPGGGVDPGESLTMAVVREVKEETGIDVEVDDVVGVYTNPRHVMAYDDGEVRQQFSLCFRARPVGGQS